MPRHGLSEPVQRFATAGALAGNKFVKLASDGTVGLAGAADANAIGVTVAAIGAASTVNTGTLVTLFANGGAAEVEVAASVTITPGNLVYQAANGLAADTGTVARGVALTGGTAGQLVEVLFT